ncbi:MAG: PorT family protein [Bacteroidia bacterium]|jgi:hypothetical protein|nr:PorT family protein [Bacteroidia bacterium]
MFVWVLVTWAAQAQPNLEQYDNKRIHFGFSLTVNNASLQAQTNPASIANDTIRNVRQSSFPGIGLGALTNLRLGDYWDLRLMLPQISFVQRNLNYTFNGSSKIIKIESAYCDGSLLLKYKSARRNNVRVYVIGGARASYDLASTVGQNRSLQSPLVSLVPFTYGYEAGAGLDIYFPYFKFSPEIKFCNTLNDALHRDGYIYTSALNRVNPQMVVISLHFE